MIELQLSILKQSHFSLVTEDTDRTVYVTHVLMTTSPLLLHGLEWYTIVRC